MNYCPTCQGDWAAMGMTMSTLVGYTSPVGHDHDDNCRTTPFRCENGHVTIFRERNKCSVIGCNWTTRRETCRTGACGYATFVDTLPTAASVDTTLY